MAHTKHIIHIHIEAPVKVPPGASCNGCGVCCMWEPCPLGMVLSRRRAGACSALRWSDSPGQYRCGAISEPEDVLARALPRGLGRLAPTLAPILRRLASRWIAVGLGCDSQLEVLPTIPRLHTQHHLKMASTTMSSSDLPTESRAVARNLHHD